MKRLLALIFCLGFGFSASAASMDPNSKDFISSNLIAIFYHELGHALIDIMKLPIYGQEEDAADVLSALLIHETFDEAAAVRVAYATAFAFRQDHERNTAGGAEVAYWDVHGPDLQRYYNFICLFYGANPQSRLAVADELNLPEGRRGTCEEEFELASRSWGPVMKELSGNGAGRSIRFLADHRADVFGKLSADVIAEKVRTMNADMSLPKSLLVRVESCGTSNAFYDPKAREIIMCTEFARSLAEMAPR
jgi:hypothetical protein